MAVVRHLCKWSSLQTHYMEQNDSQQRGKFTNNVCDFQNSLIIEAIKYYLQQCFVPLLHEIFTFIIISGSKQDAA